jgi:hypothetical protein
MFFGVGFVAVHFPENKTFGNILFGQGKSL